MSSYNKTNPTHGQKVTTDPRSKTDLKREYAGPIASDSLAAESLRSGGHFAEGNPADISSVSGSNATFASIPDRGAHFQEIKPGHKMGDQEVFETGKAGGVDEDLKTKSSTVGPLGGGKQTSEGFAGRDALGRDTNTLQTIRNPVPSRRDVEQHKKKREEERRRLGLRGGMAPEDVEEEHSDSSTTTHEVGTIGDEKVKKMEEPDWSKIPIETVPTTKVGAEEDPAKSAELYFAKMATRKTGPRFEKKDEENPYRQLSSDEAI